MKLLSLSVVGAGAVGLAVGAASVSWSSPAEASGFAAQRIGGEQGSVIATNPTAMYFNPAGIAFAKGPQLGVYFTFAVRDLTWDHQATVAPGFQPDTQLGNSGRASLLNGFGGPAIGGSMKFGNLSLGGGFFAPFFGRTHWDKNKTLTDAEKAAQTKSQAGAALAIDGVQRFFDIDTELSVLYLTVGAAYKLGPLSIGATGNLIYSTIITTLAKNPTGQGLPDSTVEGRTHLDVSGFDGSFGAGIMLEAVPDQFWLGASYQAQPGLQGQTLKGTLDVKANVGNVNNHYDVNFTQNLPDVVRGGLRYRPKGTRFEFRVFGDWTRWSVMNSQCIYNQGTACVINSDGTDTNPAGVIRQFLRLGWNDTYGGRLGVSYWIQPEIEVFAGGGYETAAIPDATMSPLNTDADNIAGTLGGRFMITDNLFMSGMYTHQQFFNRDNTGLSTLAVKNGQQVQVPTVQEDGGGVYHQWIGYIQANVEALF